MDATEILQLISIEAQGGKNIPFWKVRGCKLVDDWIGKSYVAHRSRAEVRFLGHS